MLPIVPNKFMYGRSEEVSDNNTSLVIAIIGACVPDMRHNYSITLFLSQSARVVDG